MPEVDPHPAESWLEIAAQAKKETDPKKLQELIQTLCEALETNPARAYRKAASQILCCLAPNPNGS